MVTLETFHYLSVDQHISISQGMHPGLPTHSSGTQEFLEYEVSHGQGFLCPLVTLFTPYHCSKSGLGIAPANDLIFLEIIH